MLQSWLKTQFFALLFFFLTESTTILWFWGRTFTLMNFQCTILLVFSWVNVYCTSLSCNLVWSGKSEANNKRKEKGEVLLQLCLANKGEFKLNLFLEFPLHVEHLTCSHLLINSVSSFLCLFWFESIFRGVFFFSSHIKFGKLSTKGTNHWLVRGMPPLPPENVILVVYHDKFFMN